MAHNVNTEPPIRQILQINYKHENERKLSGGKSKRQFLHTRYFTENLFWFKSFCMIVKNMNLLYSYCNFTRFLSGVSLKK